MKLAAAYQHVVTEPARILRTHKVGNDAMMCGLCVFGALRFDKEKKELDNEKVPVPSQSWQNKRSYPKYPDSKCQVCLPSLKTLAASCSMQH